MVDDIGFAGSFSAGLRSVAHLAHDIPFSFSSSSPACVFIVPSPHPRVLTAKWSRTILSLPLS